MDWTNFCSQGQHGNTPKIDPGFDLTGANFIVQQQGAKQDEQTGLDQLWIGPTLERPDGDGNGEQIDAEQSFAMESGNFSWTNFGLDKHWIGLRGDTEKEAMMARPGGDNE